MNKIKILNKEFEVGDMVWIRCEARGIVKERTGFLGRKFLGSVYINPSLTTISSEKMDGCILDAEPVEVSLGNITSINKLVYER